MKPEVVEAIERLYAAMNRRDEAALREFRSKHPGFSWDSNTDELDSPGVLTGDQLAEYSQELFRIFDELETEVLERIDLGPDQLICVVRHRVRGASSGVRVDRQEVHLWTARDNRIESPREFRSVEEARRAAVEA